jgi:hypothetical protein
MKKDGRSRTSRVIAAIGALSVAALGVGVASAQTTCKENVCVEIQRVSDVNRPLLRARAIISYARMNNRFRHYNVSIEGGQQFELKGDGPANYGPLPLELNRGQHNFSVQACSRAPGDLGFFEASECTRWANFSDQVPSPPAGPAKPEPPFGGVGGVGDQVTTKIPGDIMASPGAGGGGGPTNVCTVLLDTDLFTACQGNQTGGFLPANTQGVTLVNRCDADANWHNIKWPAGQGWVFSGPGHVSLDCK